jgi:eukaryotic-like serine/threonine-protein kinase
MINPSISKANSFVGRLIGDHNRYRIESHLGKGGMGEVYQATDTRLGKVVAIKLLKASSTHASTTAELDFKRRFERECAICAALKSENIVQVSDYGITDEDYPFYVMEYLEGHTLGQVLKQQTRLSVERTINIMIQICAGLRSAHEGVTLKTSDMKPESHLKVIHRDLKPANIFLVPTTFGERVKIIDFGVAKIQSSHLENTDFIKSFLGTHHYAAPEQFNDQESIDERADIYCLGIILYEMLVGVDPFGLKLPGQSVTGESWIKAHLIRPVQPLRSQMGCESLSIELEQIVMRCLEKNPDQRFSTVQALAKALESERNTIRNSFKAFINLKQFAMKAFYLKKDMSLCKISIQHKQVENSLSDLSLPKPITSSFVYLELINKCQAELTMHIGPIAKLIVERILNDENCQQVQRFIEALASEIPDINAANHFRRIFLEEHLISSN